jgi:hypothetical protein
MGMMPTREKVNNPPEMNKGGTRNDVAKDGVFDLS